MNGKKIALPVPSLIAATVLIIAGGLISAFNSAAPFDRGSWLAAYLVLVGGVAQIGLTFGRDLIGPPLTRMAALRLLVLWNFGSIVVPLGVLADIGLIIGLGSLALIAALWLSVRGIRRPAVATTVDADQWPGGTSSWLVAGYVGLVAMLALSVAIGGVLTDAPLLGVL